MSKFPRILFTCLWFTWALVAGGPLTAGVLPVDQAFAFGRGYEGPLRFDAEAARLLWSDASGVLQVITPEAASVEIGVGREGKLAWRIGLHLDKQVPVPLEGYVTIAGGGLRGFNFPFSFDDESGGSVSEVDLTWTPWTQCAAGGEKGDLCALLDLGNTEATSGSHVTWGHLNRVAGVTGHATLGASDLFDIQLMSLDGLAVLSFSEEFPWPEEVN